MREASPTGTIMAEPRVAPRSDDLIRVPAELPALTRINGEQHPAKKWHAPSWAVLLQRFYTRMRLPLPPIEPRKGEDVPEPYRKLLVHSSDMTPTLEAFYQRTVGLTVLSREIAQEEYLREVVLNLADGGQPIEYGVIRICLGHLPGPARARVLQEQRPLGNILRSEGLPHISWPQAFFRMQSDLHTGAVLHLQEPCDLYGRRNVLLDGNRRLLAEVIEILAPAAQGEAKAVKQVKSVK
jgi:chorismate-pyruvate lyase